MADLIPHSGRRPLRIGDAERDVAVRELGDHFAAGRIDDTEFDERASAALSARTQPELDILFADLPRPQPIRARPPARPRGPYPVLAPVLVFVLLLFLIASSGVWYAAADLAVDGTRWSRWGPPPRRGRRPYSGCRATSMYPAPVPSRFR